VLLHITTALRLNRLTPPSSTTNTNTNIKGNYELFAMVTHKGRLADGGHYMGWVRQDGDDWLVFDDDEASPCKTETVMQLKGGGDSDMAYLAFYRHKN
jgi:ubiquitin carboxyl-terminal hydrolase 14